jgi:NAD+ diphosphatase
MSFPEMTHCIQCGAPLVKRYLKDEGMIPYCPVCKAYRFPVFSTAISTIVMNEKRDHILLIRQYGRPGYILVAGYVNQGEDAEHTVCREVNEEMGLEVKKLKFNHTHYFKPTNTLMLNFTAIVKGDPNPNWEVDDWQWFTIEEARRAIRPHSLARDFLIGYLDGHYPF